MALAINSKYQVSEPSSSLNPQIVTHAAYRPYPATICNYVIHFQMAIAHECPLAAMCMAVGEEERKEVAVGSLILWGLKLDEIVGKSYQMTEMVGDSL